MNEDVKPEARAALPASDGSAWTFSKQHRQCRENGTKMVMTLERYGKLPQAEKTEAELHRKFWQASDYRGMGFCGMQPGICSLKHCRKIGNCKR